MVEVVKRLAALKIGSSSKHDNQVFSDEKATHDLKEKESSPRKCVKICVVKHLSSGSDTENSEDEDIEDDEDDTDDTDNELEIDHEWEAFKRRRAAIKAAAAGN
ncbi:hypothetical protein JOM56_011699 [Amanita muscaria]